MILSFLISKWWFYIYAYYWNCFTLHYNSSLLLKLLYAVFISSSLIVQLPSQSALLTIYLLLSPSLHCIQVCWHIYQLNRPSIKVGYLCHVYVQTISEVWSLYFPSTCMVSLFWPHEKSKFPWLFLALGVSHISSSQPDRRTGSP